MMSGIYRSTGLYLLFLCGIVRAAGDESWEELIRSSAQLCEQGKFAEEETRLLTALKVAQAFPQPDIRVAETQHQLGTVYRELGRLPEAEKWYQRSLSAWNASGSGLPKPLISLASLYLENGLDRKAERLIDPWLRDPARRLNIPDPASVRLLHNAAAIQHRKRNYARADTLYRQALAAAENTFGPKDQEVALLLNNLGLLLVDAGRHDEAREYLERSVALWEQALGPDHPDTARAMTNLAALHRSAGAYAPAESLLRQALAAAESRLGPENRLVATILAEYAIVLRKTGRKREAEALRTRAQAIRQEQTPNGLGRHTIDFRDLAAASR
jgi:tetratricopeptide (TPR) repeat protein